MNVSSRALEQKTKIVDLFQSIVLKSIICDKSKFK